MPADRNIEKKVVELYASAILQAAGGDEPTILSFDEALRELAYMYTSDRKLSSLFVESGLPGERLREMAQEVFATLPEGMRQVVVTMIARGDLGLLRRVTEAYTAKAEAALGIVIVSVVTAVELDDHLRQVIQNKLAADFGTRAVLQESVDPSIVGGIIMSAHGQRIDASVASRLESARIALSESPSGGERQ